MEAPPVLHLSALHGGTDSRVVYREGFSLVPHYALTMVLTQPDAAVHPGIRFVGVPFYAKLWQRLLLVHPRVFWHALRSPARLVHLHDAELIPLGLLLRALGRTVIWDVHENLHRQLGAKKTNRSALYQAAFRCFDRLARRQLNLIFAETSYLADYPNLRHPHAVVLNYAPLPLLEPFRRGSEWAPDAPEFFYIGQLSMARSLDVLLEALALLRDAYPRLRVHLFGAFGFDVFSERELAQHPQFDVVRKHLVFHGPTDARRAFPAANHCLAGLALVKPVGDFPGSYPTKLFEYMAVGLPVVTSDFLLYRAVVETHGCGICIDPTSPQALADALRFFIENPATGRQMGENGRRAAERQYNWASQAVILNGFYRRLLPRGRKPSSAEPARNF